MEVDALCTAVIGTAPVNSALIRTDDRHRLADDKTLTQLAVVATAVLPVAPVRCRFVIEMGVAGMLAV